MTGTPWPPRPSPKFPAGGGTSARRAPVQEARAPRSGATRWDAVQCAVRLFIVCSSPTRCSCGVDLVPRLLLRRPRREVSRPFVGFENYTAVLTDPAVLRSFGNVGIFLIINVPLTVVLSLLLATALNAAIPFRAFFRVSYYVPYVTASVATVAVWLFLFGADGLVNHILGPLAPNPSWLINPLGDAVDRALRHLEAARVLHPAVSRRAAERAEGALRVRVDGRRGAVRSFRSVTVPGVRQATALVGAGHVTGANLFTEPYLLTGGGGPDGASTSPVLLMYQKGIEQGQPDYAAAIAIVLVLWCS